VAHTKPIMGGTHHPIMSGTLRAAFDNAGYALTELVAPILANYGDQFFKGGIQAIRFTPVTGGLQVSLAFEGRTVVLPASRLENIIKGVLAGLYEVSSELLQQLIDSAIQEELERQSTL